MSNQGTITYDVAVDTAQALKSEKELDKSTQRLVSSFAKADVALKQFNASMKDMGRTVNAAGQVVDKNGKVIHSATERYKRLSENLRTASTEMFNASKVAKGVNQGLAGMSRSAGQAGIQFQQFIGQVQGGQSAMLALSQQAADIGIVLGAPLAGAIAGISASLVGMLLPSLMDSKTGLEKLQKATENVKAAMTLSAEGVIEYAEEMKKLKNISEALLKVRVATLIEEQNEALKVGIKETVKLMDDARDRFALGQLFKNTTKEAIFAFADLNKSIEKLQLDPTAESLNEVEQALLRVSEAGIDSTKQGRALSTQMSGLIAEYKLGKISIESLNKALKDSSVVTEDVTGETKKQADAVQTMVMALKEQAVQIGETARQTALRAATERGATDAQLSAINAAFDAIEAEKQKQDALKETISTQKELDRAMEKSFQDEVKRENQAKADKSKATGFAQGVIDSGMSPVQRLQQEQEQLLALKAQYVDQSALFDQALTVNAKKQADLRANYEIANANMILASSSNLFGELAGVLKASGKEQSTAYKAMFALSKGFAIAQAGLNLSLAISNASAITPWYASIPAISKTLSAGAGLASAIAGASFSGGRQFGGSTNAGSNYRINETGTPEIYSQGGKDYLMNSGGGQVTPMQEFSGGDSPVTVIINGGDTNTGGGTVSMEDRQIIIDLAVRRTESKIANDVRSGQGNVLSAFKQSTSLTTNTRGG